MAEDNGDMEMMIARYLILISPIVLIIFGTTGNLLSILVMSRKSMRSSNAAVYLIALAIADTVALNIGLINIFIEGVVEGIMDVPEFICKVNMCLSYVSLAISAWILVAFTIERFMSVFFPHKVKTFCRRGSSIIVVICIVVITSAYSSHFLYGFGNKIVNHGNVSIHVICRAISKDYSFFYRNIHIWLDFCSNCLIPLIIFIVCNSCIAARVLLRSRNMRKMNDRKATKHATRVSSAVTDRSEEGSQLTFMLFTVTVVFLFTTAPLRVLVIVLHEWLVRHSTTRKQFFVVYLLFRVSEILMYINNSVNFFLYCVTGARFRKELQKMFRELWDRIFKKYSACEARRGARGAHRWTQSKQFS